MNNTSSKKMELKVGEINQYKLDTYEIELINKKLAGWDYDVADFQKSVIFEALDIFQKCIDNQNEKINEIYCDESIKHLIKHVDRSIFYTSLYDFWSQKITAEEHVDIFSLKNAVHNFYPIFVEEIEGPLKKLLKTFDFILRIDNGENLDWLKFNSKKKYITNVVTSIQESSKNTQYISEIIEGLNPSTQTINSSNQPIKPPKQSIKIKILRNAGAHSNYQVITENNMQYVEIENSNNLIKIELNDFLGLYSMTTDLILLLNIIIHLGLRRIERQ